MAPFPRAHEIYTKLTISSDGSRISRTPTGPKTTLPGEPRVELASDYEAIIQFLAEEVTTPDLDKFHPHLWKVATQSSKHITQLVDKCVRGRSIILTENPELHLVWIQSRVYIKPLPKWLLSHACWEFFLKKDSCGAAERGAKGFVRSYAYLIRHKSDFRIAKEMGLLPQKLGYTQFVRFIKHFEMIQNDEVSLRYSYGELRLSRLNIWAPWVLGRPEFFKVIRQYRDYFEQYFAPISFVFGIFVIVLSSMQVALSVNEPVSATSLRKFTMVCWVFAILTLVVVILVMLYIMVSLTIRALRELIFALGGVWESRKKTRNLKDDKCIEDCRGFGV